MERGNMITLSEARAVLPADIKSITDQELTKLMGQIYSLADLFIDIFLERKRDKQNACSGS